MAAVHTQGTAANPAKYSLPIHVVYHFSTESTNY
jgi:hypothetical protein